MIDLETIWKENLQHFIDRGLTRDTIAKRIYAGWSLEKILSTDRQPTTKLSNTCSMRMCNQKLYRGRYCKKHYNRLITKGTTNFCQYFWGDKKAEQDMWYRAKRRAMERSLPFDLEPADIVIPEFCPVSGIRMVRGSKNMQDSSPTIERLDNSKGYTKDNILIVSLQANRSKSNMSPEELVRVGLGFLEIKYKREGLDFTPFETVRKLLSPKPL